MDHWLVLTQSLGLDLERNVSGDSGCHIVSDSFDHD